MGKFKTYFQPLVPFYDGTDLDWRTPDEIYSWQAFQSKEDCIDFMEDCGYELDRDYTISEYHDDDIEGVNIIDADGNFIE